MSEQCSKCGSKKTWLFFGIEGSAWMCDCEVDLGEVTLLPWGMSPFLDERMEWIRETIEDGT